MVKMLFNATTGEIEAHKINNEFGIVEGVDLSGETVYLNVDMDTKEVIYEEPQKHDDWMDVKPAYEPFAHVSDLIIPGQPL